MTTPTEAPSTLPMLDALRLCRDHGAWVRPVGWRPSGVAIAWLQGNGDTWAWSHVPSPSGRRQHVPLPGLEQLEEPWEVVTPEGLEAERRAVWEALRRQYVPAGGTCAGT